MIARVKQLARKLGRRPQSRRELDHATGIGYLQMLRHFASPTELVEACGLTPRKAPPNGAAGDR